MRLYRHAILMAVAAGLAVPCATSAAVLTLRNGWDPVNNVADPVNGYAGTRNATANSSDYDATTPGASLEAAQPTRRTGTVVGFDLSQYAPQISNLTSATLEMTFSKGSYFGKLSGYAGANPTYAVYDPTEQWVEGDVDFYQPQTSAGVYWDSTNHWESGHGITMGGQTAIDTVSLTYNNTTPGYTGYTVSFDVTSLITGWLSDPANNRGIAVALTPATQNSISNIESWASKTNTTVTYRPTLVLDYTPVPEPAGLMLLAAGGGVLLIRRRRYGQTA